MTVDELIVLAEREANAARDRVADAVRAAGVSRHTMTDAMVNAEHDSAAYILWDVRELLDDEASA